MTSLETELAHIGDHLQTAWRADTRNARRQQRVVLAAGLAVLLALTGAAIASDIFPITLTKTTGEPPAAALSDLRATYQPPPNTPLAPWQKGLKLDLSKAIVIAKVTSHQTGSLSIIVVPAGQHSLCIDAARLNGSSYLAGCANKPRQSITGRGHNAFDLNLNVDRITTNSAGVNHFSGPVMRLSIHTAPPHAARIDVRARDASQLPAIISHGWLLFLNPHPQGAAVLIRVYDKTGKRLLSYYG